MEIKGTDFHQKGILVAEFLSTTMFYKRGPKDKQPHLD